MGGQFEKEISQFGYFKKVEKVRIKIEWLKKLAVKIAEEMNNERYSFRHFKKSSPGWVL